MVGAIRCRLFNYEIIKQDYDDSSFEQTIDNLWEFTQRHIFVGIRKRQLRIMRKQAPMTMTMTSLRENYANLWDLNSCKSDLGMKIDLGRG